MFESLYFFANIDYFGFVDDFWLVEAAFCIFMTFRVPNAGQGKRFAVNGSTILLILDAIDPLFGDEWQM